MGFKLSDLHPWGSAKRVWEGASDALGGGGGDAPTAPDFVGAAEATAKGNLENLKYQTIANRPNEYTPWGSRTWTQDANGNWTSNTSYAPEMQGLFDQNLAFQGGLADLGQSSLENMRPMIENGFSIDQAPTFGGAKQSVMDAMLSRVNTDIGRDRDNLHSQLVAQGIPPGSEAYNREMEQLDRKQTDARQQAEIAATDMALKEFGADTASHQQTVKDLLTQRQVPLTEMMAFGSGSQANLPGFQPYAPSGTAAGPDYLGAAMAKSNWDMGQYNAQQAQQNAFMGGLMDLGGAAILAQSDKRLKHDIVKVGRLSSGINLYEFSYLGSDDRYVGVLAQEVLPVIPDAVLTMSNGFYAVDYARIH